MVNAYEPVGAPHDEQELVYRPMTDEELADYEERLANAEEPVAKPAILQMVEELDEDELNELWETLRR